MGVLLIVQACDIDSEKETALIMQRRIGISSIKINPFYTRFIQFRLTDFSGYES